MYLNSLIPKFPLVYRPCLSVPSLESLCWCCIKTQGLLFCPPPGRHHWLLPKILNTPDRHISTVLTGELLTSMKSRAASSRVNYANSAFDGEREQWFFIQVIKWLLYYSEEAENVGYMARLSLSSGGEKRKSEKGGADFIEGANFHQFEEWWKLLVVPSLSPFSFFSFLLIAKAFFLVMWPCWGC